MPHALVFDDADRAAVGWIGGGNGPVVVRRDDPIFGWRDIAAGASGQLGQGISLAADNAGHVAFAYVSQTNELIVGIHDGETTRFEIIAAAPSLLMRGSLAYDPNGDLALAYTEVGGPGDAAPLHLARRQPDGTWLDEILPVDALYASVTFDTAGQPYVGAATTNAVTLIYVPEPMMMLMPILMVLRFRHRNPGYKACAGK